MKWRGPRPDGWNYGKPDAEWIRCAVCNADGMNRTGLRVVRLIGAITTRVHGVRCPEDCHKGLKETLQ